jgi:hypothetical protein
MNNNMITTVKEKFTSLPVGAKVIVGGVALFLATSIFVKFVSLIFPIAALSAFGVFCYFYINRNTSA